MERTITTIDIPPKTVVTVALTLLSIYGLYVIGDILLFVFIGFLLLTAVTPVVDFLSKHKVPRGLAGILPITLVIISLSLMIGFLVPPLVKDLVSLITHLPVPKEITSLVSEVTFTLQDLQLVVQQISNVPKLFATIGDVFNTVIVIFSLIIFTYYLVVDRPKLEYYLKELIGKDKSKLWYALVTNVESQIGSWVRAELVLMLVVGIMTFVGLLILKIPYAVPLAIIAGILELVPNIGPIISAFPAIGVALLTGNPTMALWVAVIYLIVQQIENNVIVPIVMRSVVGLSPVVTIVTLLIGYRLGNIMGAIISIPLLLVARVVMLEWKKLSTSFDG